jgi:hypothetical protein
MRSRVALFALAAVLAGGLIQILRVRIQATDLLPEYSTLRTEPKGLAVLFDALEATAAMPVTRSNRPPGLIKDRDATLVFAGFDLFTDSPGAESAIAEWEALAGKGNRVVVSLGHMPNRFEKEWTPWDIHLIAMPGGQADEDADDEPARWPAYFQAGSDWHVLHAEKNHPVIIERSFHSGSGIYSGSIVLLASTWPLTNEAMVQDRQSELLTSLLTAKPRVIFDESHLGLEESGSVMALGRRFHLQGLLLGLLLLASLFIWRNLAGFPPDRLSPVRRSGRDSLSGLSILLARNVPEKNLIDTCLGEMRPEQRGTVLVTTVGAKHAFERYEAIRQQLHTQLYTTKR